MAPLRIRYNHRKCHIPVKSTLRPQLSYPWSMAGPIPTPLHRLSLNTPKMTLDGPRPRSTAHISWSGACVKASRREKEALGPDLEPRGWALCGSCPGDWPRMHGALMPGPSVPQSGDELEQPSWGSWRKLESSTLFSPLLPRSPRHRPPSP